MQIQVNTDSNNTDSNIRGREELVRRVETEIDGALGHYGEQITRVEVHLGDENSTKSGDDDKRCMIEARIAGHQPIAVTHHAATLDQALDGASEKMQRSLESTLGRYKDHTDRTTIRKDGGA